MSSAPQHADPQTQTQTKTPAQPPPENQSPSVSPVFTRLNPVVVRFFREAARLLEARTDDSTADPDHARRRFRITAYRRGAKVVESLREDVTQILRTRGPAGLRSLRWIGASLAASIEEIATTGRWTQLDELRQHLPEYAFYKAIPGLEAPQVLRLRDLFGVRPLLSDLRREDALSRLSQIEGVASPDAARRLWLMLAGWLALAPSSPPPVWD